MDRYKIEWNGIKIVKFYTSNIPPLIKIVLQLTIQVMSLCVIITLKWLILASTNFRESKILHFIFRELAIFNFFR